MSMCFQLPPKASELTAAELKGNICAANEGFFDRLVYTFTTDKKVGAIMSDTLKKLDSLKPEDFDKIVVDKPIFEYKTLADIITYCDITVEVGKEMVAKMDHLLSPYSAGMSDEQIRDVLREIYKILDEAGDKINKKIPAARRETFQGEASKPKPETKGKTLKELGYSQANVKALITTVSKNMAGAKSVCSSIERYSEMLPLAKIAYNSGHQGLLIYAIACKYVKQFYNVFTYFFFWLGRHLEVKGTEGLEACLEAVEGKIRGRYLDNGNWRSKAVVTLDGEQFAVLCSLIATSGKLAAPKALEAVNHLLDNFDKMMKDAFYKDELVYNNTMSFFTQIKGEKKEPMTQKEFGDACFKNGFGTMWIGGYDDGEVEIDLDVRVKGRSFPTQIMWRNGKVSEIANND